MITTLDPITALVLIDLQKGTLQQEKAHPVGGVLANAVRLADSFRAAGLPVIIFHVNPNGAVFKNARVEKKSSKQVPDDFMDIAPEIVIHPDDLVFVKESWNAFYQTALTQELKDRSITGIVLAGVSTSIGVEGTARAASERGFNITFAIDAMTDNVAEAHENSVKNIFPRMGEVGTTAEIIGKLSK